jgi:hypothetical protein
VKFTPAGSLFMKKKDIGIADFSDIQVGCNLETIGRVKVDRFSPDHV